MSVVFVEYRVAEEHRHAYMRLMEEAKRRGGFEFYEGAEQPGLFVEIWPDMSAAAYEEMKRERLGEPSGLWGDVQQMIVGGTDKTHIWRFEKVKPFA